MPLDGQTASGEFSQRIHCLGSFWQSKAIDPDWASFRWVRRRLVRCSRLSRCQRVTLSSVFTTGKLEYCYQSAHWDSSWALRRESFFLLSAQTWPFQRGWAVETSPYLLRCCRTMFLVGNLQVYWTCYLGKILRLQSCSSLVQQTGSGPCSYSSWGSFPRARQNWWVWKSEWTELGWSEFAAGTSYSRCGPPLGCPTSSSFLPLVPSAFLSLSEARTSLHLPAVTAHFSLPYQTPLV